MRLYGWAVLFLVSGTAYPYTPYPSPTKVPPTPTPLPVPTLTPTLQPTFTPTRTPTLVPTGGTPAPTPTPTVGPTIAPSPTPLCVTGHFYEITFTCKPPSVNCQTIGWSNSIRIGSNADGVTVTVTEVK